MTILAISEDTPAESAAFARDYGLGFPLLSDHDSKVSRVYAGVSSDSYTLPGITIIRGDGRIAFRQVASAKDDRMSAQELIATLDRTLGTTGPAFSPDGYAALDRLQVRGDVGGGVVVHDRRGTSGSGVAAVSALSPLGHHWLAGARASSEPREAPLSFDGVIAGRLPVFGTAGAIELGAIAGWTGRGSTGVEEGGFADFWFALTPRFALQAGVTVVVHDAVTEAFVTLGAAKLLQFR